MNITPQKPDSSYEDTSLVFVGDFNPKIYHPYWFTVQELIRESEAEKANIELVHSDFTSFSTDWFAMQITRERFSVTIKSLAYEKHLYDLVIGTFRKLEHTPINQMGINFSNRIRFKNIHDWNAFGHFLTPKSPWVGLLEKPGMRAINIQGCRSDKNTGFVGVSVEPILNQKNEVIVRVNDHSERSHNSKMKGAGFFLELLANDFECSLKRSEKIIDGLISRFVQQTSFDDGI